jgi:hypothetical protein
MKEWINAPDNIDSYIGFVYKITNLMDNKVYIGKKLFFTTLRRKPLKGRKNKRLVKIEADWRQYWGSCNELLKDIKKLGMDKFEREIISCHETRWEWSYAELKEQVYRDVLLRKDYYNGIIRTRLPGFKRR